MRGCLTVLVLAMLLDAIGSPEGPPAGGCLVREYSWHDADTPVGCRIVLPYGVELVEPRGIRALGYDAWEVGTRSGLVITEEERAKGHAALAAVRNLAVNRSLYVVPDGRGRRDSFGRPLGRLYLWRPGELIDLAEWARRNGHVRE